MPPHNPNEDDETNQARNILLVVAGGSMGAAARYGVTLAAAKLVGTGFPWGTLAVNWGGCLLIGLASGLAGHSPLMGPPERLFFVTGFLGALTTFSTYAVETVNAAKAGRPGAALVNVLLHNGGGLVLALYGMKWGWIIF